MVLGKEVLARDGAHVGAVVDVGVHGRRTVKFLLVERNRRYERVDAGEIDRIANEAVVLKR